MTDLGHCICGEPRPCCHIDEGRWFPILEQGCYLRILDDVLWHAPMLLDGTMSTNEDEWSIVIEED